MSLIAKCIKNKDKTIKPIWLMRQAGRYLPEFRDIRIKNPDFIKLCLNKNLSSEITLQPIKRFGFDAAIIFSDILMLPYGLGQKVEFKKNFGPILGELDLASIEEINERELAELDQDLFDKVFGKNSVKTVTEMRKKLSEDFVKQFQNQVDQKLMNDTIEYLIDSTKINLPAEFLIKWMKLSSEKKITIDEAKAEYEKSEKGMKYQLIESKLIIDNDLQVNFEDLKSYTTDLIKNQMQQYGQAIPDEKELEGVVARVMSNKDEIKRLTEQLTSNRILNFFKENFKYKLKKVSYDEYIKEAYPA